MKEFENEYRRILSDYNMGFINPIDCIIQLQGLYNYVGVNLGTLEGINEVAAEVVTAITMRIGITAEEIKED